jgi:hypothetical protein
VEQQLERGARQRQTMADLLEKSRQAEAEAKAKQKAEYEAIHAEQLRKRQEWLDNRQAQQVLTNGGLHS